MNIFLIKPVVGLVRSRLYSSTLLLYEVSLVDVIASLQPLKSEMLVSSVSAKCNSETELL